MNLLPEGALSWFRWLQNTPVGATVRDSPVLFPIFITIHLVGIAMLLGTILLMDLGLLGWGMRRQKPSEIADQLKSWMILGACMILFSGVFLFMARAVRCYRNPYFHLKMALLAIAAVYHLTIHNNVLHAKDEIRHPKLIAAISLVLWFGAGFAGQVFTAF